MNETLLPATDAERSPVVKALRLLADLAGSSEPVALAELSRRLKLPKPTTYRLARALEHVGFVQKDPVTRRYLVGSGFEKIALDALKHGAGNGVRRLVMSELAERIGARVNLAVLKSGNLLFVEWVESTAPLRVDIRGDLPMPVHCSASGKLLLAFGSPELRARLLRAAPFPAYTPNTITTARGLERELARIRAQAYSEDDQELIPGVNCISVPVHNRAGDVVAGLAVMGLAASLPLESLRKRLPDIRACAERISAEFGGRPLEAAPRQSQKRNEPVQLHSNTVKTKAIGR